MRYIPEYQRLRGNMRCKALSGQYLPYNGGLEYGSCIRHGIPIDPALAAACDAGTLEAHTPNPMTDVVEKLPK